MLINFEPSSLSDSFIDLESIEVLQNGTVVVAEIWIPEHCGPSNPAWRLRRHLLRISGIDSYEMHLLLENVRIENSPYALLS